MRYQKKKYKYSRVRFNFVNISRKRHHNIMLLYFCAVPVCVLTVSLDFKNKMCLTMQQKRLLWLVIVRAVWEPLSRPPRSLRHDVKNNNSRPRFFCKNNNKILIIISYSHATRSFIKYLPYQSTWRIARNNELRELLIKYINNFQLNKLERKINKIVRTSYVRCTL